MGRVIVGGVLAGIVVFLWGFVGHVLLPLGGTGFTTAPDEAKLVAALRSAELETGLYVVPWEGYDAEDEAAMADWERRHEEGPLVFLSYRSEGGAVMDPKAMVVQLVAEILAACVAGLVLRRVVGPFPHRVGVVVLFGLFAWLSMLVPQWNWFGFPTSYVAAGLVDELVGWALGGIVLAFVVKPRR